MEKKEKKKQEKEVSGEKEPKTLGGGGDGSDIFVCVSREKKESFSPFSLGVTLQFCSCCFSAPLFGSTLKCV